MRVLITGGTGYIGSAAAEAVASAGHQVQALAHTEDTAALIRERGWEAIAGDMKDTERLTLLAKGADAVIHAANTGGVDAATVDLNATRALLQGLAGSGRTLVYTSGAWVLGGGESDELSRPDAPALVAWRPGLEAEVLRHEGVRGVVVRPGIVYGRGGGIPGMLRRGELPVIGDGAQRWPLVHLDDLADLYVRALTAPGESILHGVSATMPMRELALLAAADTRVVPAGISLEQARVRLGDFADALALDQQVSSVRTRELTGWRPHGPSPVEEFLAGSYADTSVRSAA